MKRLILVLIMGVSEFAMAVTGITALQISDKRTSVFLPKSLSVPTNISFSGTVSDENESEGTRSVSISVSPTWEINKNYSLTASTSFTQEYEIEKAIYSNTSLILSLPTQKLLSEKIILAPFLVTGLPTNRNAYRDESFRGRLSLGARAYATLFELQFPVQLTYGFSGGRNLHKFRRNNFRRSNIEYFLSHTLRLSKTFNQWSMILSGSLNPAWDYEGIYEPTFSLGQTLSYRTDIGVTYSLSHSTSDRALDYRGDFSNVKLLDDYNSTISFNLAYIIK